MDTQRLSGLISAVLTPISPNTGEVDLAPIPAMADYLIQAGVSGFYCCGSTGEGVSLTRAEREQVTAAWVGASAGRVPVIVQVGHNSVRESIGLAKHAAEVGATAISATCPSYFKVDTVDMLVECMSQLAAATPQLPFYYYHIPSLTGNRLSMPRFLELSQAAIPNLVGMKYTSPELHEFLDCQEMLDGKFEIVWGVDEMLLAALATGAQAAIGSTYNIAASIYREIIKAFNQQDLATARQLQLQSVTLINVLKRFPFFAALKHILTKRGMAAGVCRCPNGNLSGQQAEQLELQLAQIGFSI